MVYLKLCGLKIKCRVVILPAPRNQLKDLCYTEDKGRQLTLCINRDTFAFFVKLDFSSFFPLFIVFSTVMNVGDVTVQGGYSTICTHFSCKMMLPFDWNFCTLVQYIFKEERSVYFTMEYIIGTY